MSDTNIGRRRSWAICYGIGAVLVLAGLWARLEAIVLGYRAASGPVPGNGQEWTPAFADAGMLVAAFGMAIVLLTMHHHLSAPPAPRIGGRGFEPVNVGGTPAH